MKDSLAVKDAHYVETLGTHARELEACLFRMKTQLEALSEEQDNQSRQMLSALSGLEQRSAAEQAFLDKYLVAGSKYQHDLNDVSYRAAADTHEQLRERLDAGVQQQEVRLSGLCRFHQRREHHLMFTSRTLYESTEERTAMLEKQKRQIAVLHDSLHTLKQKYTQAERGHAALDEELTRGYIHNLEVHASQQERVGHYRKNEQAKREKILELKSYDMEQLLVRLVNTQNLLG
ncbi:g1539 [Coccomyxa viridis]|uniref:G1539 protein n=1 Tax=Coccomyxa viridis TaxID=1274662 RepID=A0ABP1FQ37_9CHLO